MWWRTQRRIEMTSAKVSAQVKTAVADITHRVDSGLEGIETRVDAKLGAEGPDIASEVESAVNDALGAFNEQLGPIISTHVYQAVNQVKAQEAKSLQAQLEELGVPQMVEEGKALVAEQLPPQLMQAQRILQMKVSKKYAAEHPIEAQALEMGKLYLMQFMQGQLGTRGAEHGAVTEAAASRGFGVR